MTTSTTETGLSSTRNNQPLSPLLIERLNHLDQSVDEFENLVDDVVTSLNLLEDLEASFYRLNPSEPITLKSNLASARELISSVMGSLNLDTLESLDSTLNGVEECLSKASEARAEISAKTREIELRVLRVHRFLVEMGKTVEYLARLHVFKPEVFKTYETGTVKPCANN